MGFFLYELLATHLMHSYQRRVFENFTLRNARQMQRAHRVSIVLFTLLEYIVINDIETTQ